MQAASFLPSLPPSLPRSREHGTVLGTSLRQHRMEQEQREHERDRGEQYPTAELLHRAQQVETVLRLNLVSIRGYQLLLAMNR